MATSSASMGIHEYLRDRLMPVEGVIPQWSALLALSERNLRRRAGYALRKDQRLHDAEEADMVDDKTAFIIKRSETEAVAALARPTDT